MTETGYVCVGFGMGALLGVIWCVSCYFSVRASRDKEWIATGKNDKPLKIGGLYYCAFEVDPLPPLVEHDCGHDDCDLTCRECIERVGE